ncbi:hypothetical protein J2Z35_002306 [Acetoanaerobium pronyense]|uniref:Uncharacterized protein n=1 Tax=Acetoanaerobium pronyense TaxID=1482736 RepID=A0ABS4KL14_9FIRM|nr:hypothetical protein [Acetoanaerobium pronyense]MBP2028481.1 hypothetical protein [Acetoanaerobium pronyense]
MKKLNKFLSLFLVLVLLIPFLPASIGEASPLTQYPVLTGDQYFNISNSPYALGGVSSTVEFSTTIDDNGNEVNERATFSVVSTGNYTAGALSWKTTRIVVAVDFYNPFTKKIETMGYQFRPDELIMANNATTTITINKAQAVAGISNGMSALGDMLYSDPTVRESLEDAIAKGFENGCGLTVNAEISKFYVPAGFESNRELLVNAPTVGSSIWVLPQDNRTISHADNLARLRAWGAGSPSFNNPNGFANDAITRAKYTAGNAGMCDIPQRDLNVPDLSITVDNGGDITCEATVENSFTDNLKRVQFVWELETPAGTVVL